jgi:hypothetical protein
MLAYEPFTLTAISGSGPTDVWVAGGMNYPSLKSVMYHGSAKGGFKPDLSNGVFPAIAGVWSSAPNDAWAVGPQTLLHNTGSGWAPFTAIGDTLTAIWGSASNRIFALSSGGVLQYNGTQWTITEPASLGACCFVTGVGQDVFAVGAFGVTQIAGPTSIFTANAPASDLYGV